MKGNLHLNNLHLIVTNLIGAFVTDFITRENITLLIAMWGAVLATYKIISDYRKNVRSIKVQLAYGFVTRGNQVGPTILNIQANNIGYRDITLSSVGLILNNESQLLIMDPQSNVQFPHTLGEGKSCIVWKEQRELAQELKNNGLSGEVKIKGFYRSAIGRVYKSKPIKFNTEKVE